MQRRDPQQIPQDETRTLTTKAEDDRLFLLEFGKERSTTRNRGPQLNFHENPRNHDQKVDETEE